MEVLGTADYSGSAEATKCKLMKYFETVSNRIKSYEGSANSWWLRSPSINDTTSFLSINYGGGCGSRGATLWASPNFAAII